MVLKTARDRFQQLLKILLKENLSRGKATAAVSLGVFIGVVPIYGLQSIAAFGLATLFRLNRMLTFAATFINNFVTQPLLIFLSLETGYFILEQIIKVQGIVRLSIQL